MIFIVSGPGGVGKGTVVRELVAADPTLWLSRSWTTRAQRPGEASDAYNFVTEEQFREHIAQDGFLEWVEFLGAMYGTPIPDAPPGKDVLLEIELKGAQIIRAHDDEAIVILLTPPSIEEQRKRLMKRGDSPERVEQRVQFGIKEMAHGEEIANEIVVNDDLETTVQVLAGIIQKYRLQRGN